MLKMVILSVCVCVLFEFVLEGVFNVVSLLM